MFGYSWVREGQHSDLCHAILDDMDRFDIALESSLHTETGPGVYEVAIKYDDALRAAGQVAAAFSRRGMKRNSPHGSGYSVTFMAKVERERFPARAATCTSPSGRTERTFFTTPLLSTS